jgi:hypothetical protein
MNRCHRCGAIGKMSKHQEINCPKIDMVDQTLRSNINVTHMIMAAYIYLIKKNKDQCELIAAVGPNNIIMEPILIRKEIDKYYYSVTHISLKDVLSKCHDKRLIFLLVRIVIDNRASHSAVIVIDKEDKSVEYYDSSRDADIDNINNRPNPALRYLENSFKDLGYTFHDTPSFCPIALRRKKHSNPKTLKNDPGGFCAYWTLWWIEMRLLNPNVPRDKLMEYIQEKHILNNITQFIRDYAVYISEATHSLVAHVKSDLNLFLQDYTVSLPAETHYIDDTKYDVGDLDGWNKSNTPNGLVYKRFDNPEIFINVPHDGSITWNGLTNIAESLPLVYSAGKIRIYGIGDRLLFITKDQDASMLCTTRGTCFSTNKELEIHMIFNMYPELFTPYTRIKSKEYETVSIYYSIRGEELIIVTESDARLAYYSGRFKVLEHDKELRESYKYGTGRFRGFLNPFYILSTLPHLFIKKQQGDIKAAVFKFDHKLKLVIYDNIKFMKWENITFEVCDYDDVFISNLTKTDGLPDDVSRFLSDL